MKILKTIINNIPTKLRVCISVFIIGLIMLISTTNSDPNINPIADIFHMIGAAATILGIVSLVVYWGVWAENK